MSRLQSYDLTQKVVSKEAYYAYARGQFDGVNDYYTVASLPGIADSQVGTCSFWMRLDEVGGNEVTILNENTVRFFLIKDNANKILFQAYNSAGVLVLSLGSSATYTATYKWIHVLASWNLATGASSIYINDIASGTAGSITIGETIDYAGVATWSVGARGAGTFKYPGILSDFYFNTNEFIDFTVVNNRRKFIDNLGLPVDLGADGRNPTGNQPTIWLRERPDLFQENKGSANNTFTVNGALTVGTSSPSDLYYQNASTFDGTNDYATIAALTGIADGTTGIFSAWLRVDGGSGTLRGIFRENSGSSRFDFRITATNTLQFVMRTAAGTVIYDFQTVLTFAASSRWLHVLCSWDTSGAGVVHLYVNDVSSVAVTTNNSPGTIDYASAAAWSIAATSAGGNKFTGSITELYFAPNQFLDFSVVANRRKFITEIGRPAVLGIRGQLPTGISPITYNTGQPGMIRFNGGTDGNFTLVGTPDLATSTPTAVPAVDFDGTNDYLSRGAALSGISNSNFFSFSCWMRVDGGDGTVRVIFNDVNVTVRVFLELDVANRLEFGARDAAGTSIFHIRTTGTFAAASTWYHVCGSINTSTAAYTLFVNDVSDSNIVTNQTPFTIPWATPTNWLVGAYNAGTLKWNGALSQIWISSKEYVDFSDIEARRQFINAYKKPVEWLGTDGSLPTGTVPDIYLRNSAFNFGTNTGSGGDFTITGALDIATPSPTDFLG